MDIPGESAKPEPAERSAEKEEEKGLIPADRLKALADGIFAVAMTLLVLELVIPEIRDPTNRELTRALFSMWPKFLAYALSFLIGGIFWLVHHSIFDAIKYYDSTLAWINILFLLLVALIPFSTSLLGEYFLQKTSTIIYGIHLLLLFFGGYSLWSYSTSRHILMHPVDQELVKGAKRMGYLYFVVLSVAIIVGFFIPLISVIIYSLFVLIIIVFTGVGKALRVFSIPSGKKPE